LLRGPRTLAEISLKRGDETAARAEIEKCRHLADSARDSTLKLKANVVQAKIDARWGNAATVVPVLQSAAKEALKSGDLAFALEVRMALGEAQHKAGHVAEAQATLSSAGRDAKAKSFAMLAKKAEAASRDSQ
jgi:hypothetical protein